MKYLEFGADRDYTSSPPLTLLVPWSIKLSDGRIAIGWYRYFTIIGSKKGKNAAALDSD